MKVWRYDVLNDLWDEYEEYSGWGVYDLSTVSFEDIVYVGLGFNNGDYNAIDFWSFK